MTAIAELERVIAENAVLLGEEPSIGVHRLRDGRVRVYSLDRGWRRSGYKEYRSEAAALKAARLASERAQYVAARRAEGVPTNTAVWMAQRDVPA